MYRVFTRMPVELTVGDSGLCCCEDVPLVEFMYRVSTRMPGGVTVGDSGLCCEDVYSHVRWS